jgi:hypothetical protein
LLPRQHAVPGGQQWPPVYLPAKQHVSSLRSSRNPDSSHGPMDSTTSFHRRWHQCSISPLAGSRGCSRNHCARMLRRAAYFTVLTVRAARLALRAALRRTAGLLRVLRVPGRAALGRIIFVLRTGTPWEGRAAAAGLAAAALRTNVDQFSDGPSVHFPCARMRLIRRASASDSGTPLATTSLPTYRLTLPGEPPT